MGHLLKLVYDGKGSHVFARIETEFVILPISLVVHKNCEVNLYKLLVWNDGKKKEISMPLPALN